METELSRSSGKMKKDVKIHKDINHNEPAKLASNLNEVLQEKNEKLQEKNDELQTKNDALQEKNKALQEKVDSRSKDIDPGRKKPEMKPTPESSQAELRVKLAGQEELEKCTDMTSRNMKKEHIESAEKQRVDEKQKESSTDSTDSRRAIKRTAQITPPPGEDKVKSQVRLPGQLTH